MPELIQSEVRPTLDSDPESDATLAAIDRGLEDLAQGNVTNIDEVRKLIPVWISEFASRGKR